MMHIGWPQGIYLALSFLGLCHAASKHGQPKTGTHDMGSTLFATGAILGLLYWGGFFG